MKVVEKILQSKISDLDDFNFWQSFLRVWQEDFQSFLCEKNAGSDYEIFLEIGVCSHWSRPNQARLLVAGGFAYPAGYGGSENYGYGIPEFDWSAIFYWNKESQMWEETEKYFGKRKMVCRVALPNRTSIHSQAVANVVWQNGTPKNPKEKLKMFYAFRKINNEWKFIASDKL